MTNAQAMDATEWAAAMYGAVPLKDRRRTARLVAMAAGAAEHPAGHVTQVYAAAGDRAGAYDWLENPAIGAAAIGRAQRAHTLAQCAGVPFVYVPLDFTDLPVVDTQHVKGTGRLGTQYRPTRGFKVMTALCIRPDGVVAGLGLQLSFTWPEGRVGDSHLRPLAEKETRFWDLAVVRIASTFALACPTTTPWFLADRGADLIDTLLAWRQQERLVTVRAKHDRRLWCGAQTQIRAHVTTLPCLGTYAVDVPAHGPAQPARRAWVEVRGGEVTLAVHDRLADRDFAVTLWAVWAHEPTPPAGVEALDWLLYTSYPVTDFADACLVIAGYLQRWRIEDFHRTWKSGACHVTETQLRSAVAIEKWARLVASVAVRLLQLRDRSRQAPATPATALYSEAEIEATIVLRQPRDHVAGQMPTAGRVTRWIADLGGYTGRSSGGPPGVVVLGRGLEKVQIVVEALANARIMRWGQ